MHPLKMVKVVIVAVALMMTSAALGQSDEQGSQSGKTIEHVPIKSTSPASGKQMFDSYCAACHGRDGKGDGPAADALKVKPTDLTMLSKDNGGKFPAMKVASAIRGDANVPAHGNKEMPVWGQLFSSISGGHESEVDQRIANLSRYIQSLQAK